MKTDNISRRKFLLTGSALATMPTLGLMAQEKKVFMDWTYSQLNDQLDQGPYLPSAPELKKFVADFSEKSSKFSAKHPPKTFSYGSSDSENKSEEPKPRVEEEDKATAAELSAFHLIGL
jgi:hypothetical protein